MSERMIECPRCGRSVNVPTTGEKVWCSGCGQKFRFDAGNTPELPPADPPAEESPADRPPDWAGESADTDIDSYYEQPPTDDEPAEEPQPAEQPREPFAQPTPEEDDRPAQSPAEDEKTWRPPEPRPVVPQPAELRCVACGRVVLVPTNGTPVNCEGCGQEYRLDLSGGANAPAQPPPLEPVEQERAGADTDEVKEIDCPRCGHKVIVPVTGAKVRCPGCRQKFRFDPNTFEQMTGRKVPPPLELAKPPAAPDDLLALWPSLSVLIAKAYEDALVDDIARVEFRDKTSRASELAAHLLPAPVDAPSSGYTFITSVLPQTTLDEIVRLSIAEYRQLQESLEEAQQLLDEQLAQRPDQGLPSILSALPPTPPPAAAKPAPRSNLGFYVGLAAIAVAIVVALVIVPRIVEQMRQEEQTQGPRLEDMLDNEPRKPKPPPVEAKNPEPETPRKTDTVDTKNGETKVPEFDPTKPTPPAKQEQPQVVEPGQRYYSRWKPGPDGWITVFNGTNLDGLLGDPAIWTVQDDGILQGAMPGGIASIGVDEAAWTHFQLRFEAMLGTQGSLAVRQGKLRVRFTDKEVWAGYGEGQRVAAIAKGLARKSWYPIAIDFNNASLNVTIRGVQALASAARREERSNPLFEVENGAVRIRNIALRIHDHDEDYAAVVLGEGYANKPESPIVVPEAPQPVPGLPLGEHTLFDGESLDGWSRTGGWTILNGAMLARAATGQLAVATAGNLEWRDVVFQAEASLTRKGRMPRDGEYFLILFRCQDPANFLCVRFALEGIYEIGYYRNGRWAETGRARFGLGSDFNKWHTIQVKVVGKKLDIVIDGNSTGPTLPIAYWGKGLVGVAVTGGEAVFRNVRVRALR